MKIVYVPSLECATQSSTTAPLPLRPLEMISMVESTMVSTRQSKFAKPMAAAAPTFGGLTTKWKFENIEVKHIIKEDHPLFGFIMQGVCPSDTN